MTTEGCHRYPGSVPFGESTVDTITFRGRAYESRALYHAVLANPFVVLYSQSGLGKTSLLRAGVFPELRNAGYAPTLLRFTGLTSDPIASVVDQFNAEVEEDYELELTGPLENGADSRLVDYFLKAEVWEGHRLRVPVLVFDQFEELFTLARSAEAQAAIETEFAALARLAISGTNPADGSDVPIRVVVAMREDFLGSLEQLAASVPQIFQTRMRLEALTTSQATAAIVEPAAVDDPCFSTEPFTYSDECLHDILEYLASTGGEIEPTQLQIVCEYAEDLIETRQLSGAPGRVITSDDLGGPSGIARILEHFYGRQLEQLPADQRQKARRLCEAGLISDQHRRLFRAEEELIAEFGVDKAMLRRLVELRLLRREDRRNLPYYELAHDSLVEPIRAHREAQLKEVKTPLTEPAKQWNRLKRDPGSLLRGEALAEAEEWADANTELLGDLELEAQFLRASREERERDDMRKRDELERDRLQKQVAAQRYRFFTVGLALAIVFALFFLWQALSAQDQAEAARDVAEAQTVLAQKSTESAQAKAEEEGLARARADDAVEELTGLVEELADEDLSEAGQAALESAGLTAEVLAAAEHPWDPACDVDLLATLELTSGASVMVREHAKEAFEIVDRIMTTYAYGFRSDEVSGYDCRTANGSDDLDSHAYGIAVDYNHTTNPASQEQPPNTDMPDPMVADILALRTVNGSPIFQWGGDWTNPVPMHFEVAVSPEELDSGIDADSAVMGPPLSSWIAVLSSVEVEQGPAEARVVLDRLMESGIDARLLWSDDFGSLNNGFLVVYAGPFDSDAAAAEACNEWAQLVPDCNIRQLALSEIVLEQGGPSGQNRWYKVSLSGFPPGARVTLTCRSAANADGFFDLQIVIGADGTYAENELCNSGPNQEHWVTGGGVESNREEW